MDNDAKTDSQKEKNPEIWDDVTHISFCAELGKYLALNGSVEVLLNEVNNKIKNAKDITKPEIIVMKLILVLNPSTKTFNTQANQKINSQSHQLFLLKSSLSFQRQLVLINMNN